MNRPPQIQAQHLEKLVIVFVRQSTADQVRDDTGSMEVQRRQADRPRQWGWPESRILISDDDSVQAGSRSGRRHGYRQILELMRRDEVAIAFLRDATRLCRHPLEAVELVGYLTRHGVFVEVAGRLYAPGDSHLAALFNVSRQGLIVWWDHANLRRQEEV